MDTLTESDVPSPDADWETIGDFAILLDFLNISSLMESYYF